MSLQRLFVYGSLQPGGTNAHELESVEGTWSPGVVSGRLMAAGWGAGIGYPGLILDEGGEDVPGFVLESAALATEWPRLDAFEGDEYARVEARVRLASGGAVEAFVYVIRDPEGQGASAPRLT